MPALHSTSYPSLPLNELLLLITVFGFENESMKMPHRLYNAKTHLRAAFSRIEAPYEDLILSISVMKTK